MKKLLAIFFAVSVSIFTIVPFVFGEEVTEEVVFEWDQEDLTNLNKWEMHWSTSAGGAYTKLTDITYDGSQVLTFTSPVTAIVTGQQATVETRYFVLRACGNIPQQDGSTSPECSDWSNEISYAFWIPAGKFSIPVQFRIKVQ